MTGPVSHPKYYAGTKNINIYDPVFFLTLIASKVFIPVISPLKVNKEGVLMYLLQVKDVNRDLTLDVVFSLPEEMSASVKLSSPEEEGGDLQAVWETNDAASDTYKADVNRLLECWLNQIQHANSFSGQPTVYLLSRSAKLKWPWKNCTNEDYFRRFRSDTQIHQLRLGVGYFSAENNSVGVTIQLSNYPGHSLQYLQDSSKRRSKRSRTEVSEAVESASVEETPSESMIH